jgi:hypothetical protein
MKASASVLAALISRPWVTELAVDGDAAGDRDAAAGDRDAAAGDLDAAPVNATEAGAAAIPAAINAVSA